jgi:transposase-like protein
MVSAMKIADIKSDPPFRVRVNRTGRRTFSREYKLEIVEECSAPGASIATVALSHRINANQVRKWIVQHRAGRLSPVANRAPAMLPITLEATARPSLLTGSESAPHASKRYAAGVIEIELERARIRVRGTVDGTALRMVLDALQQR